MHHLILEMAIAGLESCLLFVAFLNLHSMVGIDEVQLGEPFCSAQLV